MCFPKRDGRYLAQNRIYNGLENNKALRLNILGLRHCKGVCLIVIEMERGGYESIINLYQPEPLHRAPPGGIGVFDSAPCKPGA